MIRPEARVRIVRFAEALAGVAVLALGAYWAFLTGGGLLHWVGYAVMALGAALTLSGLQRARFRQGSGGPGVVQVIEGRIGYFGPHGGGMADTAALSRLVLDRSGALPHWVLHHPGEPPLEIPLSAKGGDALFDAFAALPGLDVQAMLRAMNDDSAISVTVWRRAHAPVHPGTPRLH